MINEDPASLVAEIRYALADNEHLKDFQLMQGGMFGWFACAIFEHNGECVTLKADLEPRDCTYRGLLRLARILHRHWQKSVYPPYPGS
jgi:hypothetical protein